MKFADPSPIKRHKERHAAKAEVRGFSQFTEQSHRERAEQYVEKLTYQIERRFGEVHHDDPRLKLLEDINTQLRKHANVPDGPIRLLGSPDINAFVVKTRPEVFVYGGLLKQYAVWCKKNNEPVTVDALAMFAAHELGHINQQTEEVSFDDDGKQHKASTHGEKHQAHLNAEYDADHYGIHLLARAGYNPREGLKAIRFLLSLDKGTGIPTTHPRSADRLRELIAAVESPDTIIQNTDKEPDVLNNSLVELLIAESGAHPGTALYRDAAKTQLEEYAQQTDNLPDLLEVVRVADMHRMNVELDQARRDKAIRSIQAKQIALVNICRAVQAVHKSYGYQHFHFKEVPWPSLTMDIKKATQDSRFVAREYDYADTAGDDRGSITYAIEILEQKELDAEVAKTKTYIQYFVDSTRDPLKQQYQEMLEAIDPVLTATDDSSLMAMAASNEMIVDTPESGHNPKQLWEDRSVTHRWIKEQTGSAIIEWCTQNAAPFFADKIPIDAGQVSNGIAEIDSRYQGYLDSELLEPDDLTTDAGRQAYLEQVIWLNVRQTTIESLSKYTDVSESYAHNEHYINQVAPILYERLLERYASAGTEKENLAREISSLILSVKPIEKIVAALDEAIQKLSIEQCQAWLNQVKPDVVTWQSSADASFQVEVGVDQLMKAVNPSLLLHSIESRCADRVVRRLQVYEPSAHRESLDELLHLYTVSEGNVQNDYRSRIQDVLKKISWHHKTVDELEVELTPVLQLFSRLDRRFILLSLDFGLGKDLFSDTYEYLAQVSPDYAADLAMTTWEDAVSAQSPQQRLRFAQRMYEIERKIGGILTEKSFMGGELGSSLGMIVNATYVESQREMGNTLPLVDVLIQFMQAGITLETGARSGDKKLFDSDAFQAELDALPDSEVLRLAQACVAAANAGKLFINNDELRVPNFARLIGARALATTGVQIVGENKYNFTDRTTYSFDERAQFIVAHMLGEYRLQALHTCYIEYGIEDSYMVESGLYKVMSPIRRTTLWLGGANFDRDLASTAADYDATMPPLKLKSSGSDGSKGFVLKAFFKKHPITTDRSHTPEQRFQTIVDMIPEETDYRDQLFGQIEADFLNEVGLTVEGHKIINSEPSQIAVLAKQLHEFYATAIPIMVDQGQAQLWGRRANALYVEYLRPDSVSCGSELQRIAKLFPVPSFARDEALMTLAESGLMQTPEVAFELRDMLYAFQRRTADKKTLAEQSNLERMNVVAGMLSRSEKKDFLLWTMGETNEPSLTLKAFGATQRASVEYVPDLVFAATANEREEFLLRMLVGSNGLFEPQNPEDRHIFNEFVQRFFDHVFPEDADTGIMGAERQVLETIFVTVFTEYEPYRRSKILIGMLETMKGKTEVGRGEKITTLLSELGPVFVKAGQVLSETERESGVPLLPDDIRVGLRTLKQSAKRFSPLAALFSLESAGEFDLDKNDRIVGLGATLASASIKQVNVALRADGFEVVEKIKRPSIDKHLKEDLRVLGVIIERIQSLTEVPAGLNETAARWIREESDFPQEVVNTEAVATSLRDYAKHRVVKHFPVRTVEVYKSSESHIQEEKVDGIALEDLMRMAADPAVAIDVTNKYGLSDADVQAFQSMVRRIDQLRLQAFDTLLYQYFQADTFHADPHAGNWFVTKTGELVMIDNGSVGHSNVEPEGDQRPNLRKFFVGYILNRPSQLREAVQGFVTGIAENQLDRIMEVMQGDANDANKMNQTLHIASEGNTQLHPVFESFLKSLSTSLYLLSGIDRSALAPSVITYTQTDSDTVLARLAPAVGKGVSLVQGLVQRLRPKS